MTRKKPSRRQMQSLCAEIRDDDGVDPRDYFKSSQKRGTDNHKDLQLCRQVAESLDLILSGELNDDILRGVQVVAVTPAPDASQLLVLLAPLPGESLDARAVLDRLGPIMGHLRSEIASTITRRRTPKLLFQVLASEFSKEDQR